MPTQPPPPALPWAPRRFGLDQLCGPDLPASQPPGKVLCPHAAPSGHRPAHRPVSNCPVPAGLRNTKALELWGNLSPKAPRTMAAFPDPGLRPVCGEPPSSPPFRRHTVLALTPGCPSTRGSASPVDKLLPVPDLLGHCMHDLGASPGCPQPCFLGDQGGTGCPCHWDENNAPPGEPAGCP